MVMVQENSVSGVSGLLTSQEIELYDALKSRDINEVLNGSVKYGEVLKCLITYESQYNPNATGDGGLAFGILQFHRNTFDTYSHKYELELDYKNPIHQIILADLMLQDDFDNIIHWSPWRKCYAR
jgi:hypothetical protein